MKIVRKPFYFVRHGESEHNANPLLSDEIDVDLTPRGRLQAESIQPIIDKLPIQTICVSPMLRALVTKDIIAKNIQCQVYVIEELKECSMLIWSKMVEWEKSVDSQPLCKTVQQFMERAILGVNRALNFPGPVLIVAHGGIHFAMTHHMDIQGYSKKVDNCVPMHFYSSEEDPWQAMNLRLVKE